MFFKYLILEDLILENPADFLEPPKIGRKLPVVLSPEEIDKMILIEHFICLENHTDLAHRL
jgi:site-specific recombinase XerD